jgi:hypothetical protein
MKFYKLIKPLDEKEITIWLEHNNELQRYRLAMYIENVLLGEFPIADPIADPNALITSVQNTMAIWRSQEHTINALRKMLQSNTD